MSLNTTAPSYVTGQVVTAAQLNALQDGIQAVWSTYTPALTASTLNPTLGTGSSALGRHLQVGKTIKCQGRIAFGTSGVGTGTGTYRVSLPVNANVSAWTNRLVGIFSVYDGSASAFLLGGVYLPNTAYFEMQYQAGAGLTAYTTVTNATPMAWAAGDEIRWQIEYEGA